MCEMFVLLGMVDVFVWVEGVDLLVFLLIMFVILFWVGCDVLLVLVG